MDTRIYQHDFDMFSELSFMPDNTMSQQSRIHSVESEVDLLFSPANFQLYLMFFSLCDISYFLQARKVMDET